MDSVNYEINKFVLLTGAGFTHIFDGFLAKEMWSLIFNSPEVNANARIKALLKNDFSYESIYYKIIEGDFTAENKKAITNAVRDAYRRLDNKILAYKRGDQPVSIADVNQFIERFAGHHGKKGFFFTLNQDLFIERYCRPSNYTPITLGTAHRPNHSERVLGKSDYVFLPNSIDAIKDNRLVSIDFLYVKLHGSYHWKSHDGSDKMVIGMDKEKQIQREPLLNYYFDCFKEVLSKNDIRLFVIGYGFGDEHINKIIAGSITNSLLSVYVLNPSSPEEFKNRLINTSPLYWEAIWNGIKGYYPYSLSQVFPGTESVEYQLIRDSYFNS